MLNWEQVVYALFHDGDMPECYEAEFYVYLPVDSEETLEKTEIINWFANTFCQDWEHKLSGGLGN